MPSKEYPPRAFVPRARLLHRLRPVHAASVSEHLRSASGNAENNWRRRSADRVGPRRPRAAPDQPKQPESFPGDGTPHTHTHTQDASKAWRNSHASPAPEDARFQNFRRPHQMRNSDRCCMFGKCGSISRRCKLPLLGRALPYPRLIFDVRQNPRTERRATNDGRTTTGDRRQIDGKRTDDGRLASQDPAHRAVSRRPPHSECNKACCSTKLRSPGSGTSPGQPHEIVGMKPNLARIARWQPICGHFGESGPDPADSAPTSTKPVEVWTSGPKSVTLRAQFGRVRADFGATCADAEPTLALSVAECGPNLVGTSLVLAADVDPNVVGRNPSDIDGIRPKFGHLSRVSMFAPPLWSRVSLPWRPWPR